MVNKRSGADPDHPGQTNKGFTLIEMMIVVVIIAVLATVAIIAYTRHIKKGRIVQEKVFVSKIQSLQETYFQQSGFYYDVCTGNYDPATTPKDKLVWNSDMTKLTRWEVLGARPENGITYFQWDVTASVPPAGDPTNHAFTGIASSALGMRPDVAWYYIRAKGDLAGDGGTDTEIFATSTKTEIWTQNEGK